MSANMWVCSCPSTRQEANSPKSLGLPVVTKPSGGEFSSVPREVWGGRGCTHTMKSWMTQLREERGGGGGGGGWIKQSPEQGEEEEMEENEGVERRCVGGLRGKELLHNHISRVFSCCFSPTLFWMVPSSHIHPGRPYPCLSRVVFTLRVMYALSRSLLLFLSRYSFSI